MTTTVDTGAIAVNVKTEIPALLDRMGAAAVYSAKELGTRKWMLDSATISHTETTVSVRFDRGSETLADMLGTALLDGASGNYFATDAEFLAAGGHITTTGRTITLTY